MKSTEQDPPKGSPARSSASDALLLLGSGVLLATVLFAAVALSDRYGIPEFWFWGTWMGPLLFFLGVRALRPRFKQRGFLYYCAGWFPVHMAVMYVAAGRLPILIALFPVFLEMSVGAIVAYWLFAPRRP